MKKKEYKKGKKKEKYLNKYSWKKIKNTDESIESTLK